MINRSAKDNTCGREPVLLFLICFLVRFFISTFQLTCRYASGKKIEVRLRGRLKNQKLGARSHFDM